MKRSILLIIATHLLLTGCANVPAIIEAASHDHANVHIEITTIWGKAVYDRNNPKQRGNN